MLRVTSVLLLILVFASACGGDEVKSTSEPIETSPTPTNETAAEATTKEPTRPPTNTPRPTPRGAELEILSSHSYASDFGSAYIVGELENVGDTEASSIEVAVTLLDAQGNTIGSGSDGINLLTILPPGQKTPYKITLFDAPAEWADSNIQAQWTDASSFDRSFSYTRAIEVSGTSSAVGQFGDLTVTGQVTNRSGAPVSSVNIILVGRDATGTVTYVDEGYAELSSLNPDASSPFTLSIFSPPEPFPDTIEFIAQALPR